MAFLRFCRHFEFHVKRRGETDCFTWNLLSFVNFFSFSLTKLGALSDSGTPGNDMTPHFQRRCFRAHKARAFKPTFSPTPVLDFHLMRQNLCVCKFSLQNHALFSQFYTRTPSCHQAKLLSRAWFAAVLLAIARLIAIICPQLQQTKTRFGAADEDFTFYSIGQNHPHCRSEPHICLAVRQRFTSSFPSVSRETHDFSV